MEDAQQHILLQAYHVHKWYDDGPSKKIILDDLNLSIHEGEFVALLGPSGSGKSTFLRIMAGLIPPSEGRVASNGSLLIGPNPGVAIVFQTFALYPWLTVEKNVELGLIAKNLSKAEKAKRVSEAMHLIGLHGFEAAYPKEISGGMKQRVGFARALVVQPEILMMDEPFSALDVLTAESLRHELLSLWLEKKIPTKAILMVTHNIDEAVSMADRLLVLSSDPGRFRVEVPGLPVEKRNTKCAERIALVDHIYQVMTNPHVDPKKLIHGITHEIVVEEESPYQVIPQINMGIVKGFLRRLATAGGKEELHVLQDSLSINVMLPLAELIEILDFGGVEGNKMVLTEIGKDFVNAATIDHAKKILRKQLVENVALIQFIMTRIQENPKQQIAKKEVMAHLQQYFPAQDALIQFKAVVAMGVYAELFSLSKSTLKIAS